MTYMYRLHGYTFRAHCNYCDAEHLTDITEQVKNDRDSQELQAMLPYSYWQCCAGHISAFQVQLIPEEAQKGQAA